MTAVTELDQAIRGRPVGNGQPGAEATVTTGAAESGAMTTCKPFARVVLAMGTFRVVLPA